MPPDWTRKGSPPGVFRPTNPNVHSSPALTLGSASAPYQFVDDGSPGWIKRTTPSCPRVPPPPQKTAHEGGKLLARANALLKKIPFHRIACQRERSVEVVARVLKMSATNFEFTECSLEERVGLKPLHVLNRTDLLQSTLRSFALGYGNGTVEGHDG